MDNYYLSSYLGDGLTEENRFRAIGAEDHSGTGTLDLRTDFSKTGPVLIASPQPITDTRLIDLGNDPDVISNAVQKTFSSKFNTILAGKTLRQLVPELWLKLGSITPTVQGSYEIKFEGRPFWSMPAIRGGSTITDSFNRADQTGLGTSSEGWSWSAVETSSTFDIVTNQAKNVTSAGSYTSARADSDLASTNHYVQADMLLHGNMASSIFRTGMCVRKDSTATVTCYFGLISISEKTIRHFKLVNAAITELGTGVAITILADTSYTCKVQINGTTLDMWFDTAGANTNKQSTDSAISTGTRVMLRPRGDSASTYTTYDIFSAADLAGAITLPVGIAGGLVQSYEDAMSPYRLVAA